MAERPPKDFGLRFHPHAGILLMCDFRGSIAPEINKRRPVVVVTPRLPHRNGLCMVVPISTTAPHLPQPYHVGLSRNYVPSEDASVSVWAKCDLITNVSLGRLDRFKVGPRRFEAPRVTPEDLRRVRAGVLAALGFPSLTDLP